MAFDKYDLAWQLMVELRKEMVETQRIRAQVIGFKITFVSAGLGLIAANIEKVPSELLLIPAFAAVFFDLLVNGYSISIARIGVYSRAYIEPILRAGTGWPKSFPLWEEFMVRPKIRPWLPIVGNVGLTALAVIAGLVALFHPFRIWLSVPIGCSLVAFLAYDVAAHFRAGGVVRGKAMEGALSTSGPNEPNK